MPRKCTYLQGEASELSYSATDDRTVTSSFMGGVPFTTAIPGTGMIGRGHGVMSADALQVTADGTNSVYVNPGIVSIRGTQTVAQGVYICPLSEELELTVPAAHPTLPRDDIVVATVKDSEFPELPGEHWDVDYITGAPGGGIPTVPNDSAVLAQIRVNAGANTVVNPSNVSDLRPQTRAHGSIVPVPFPGAFPGPQNSDIIWDMSTERLLIRTGGSWRPFGVNYSANWRVASGPFHDGSVTGGTGFENRCEFIEFGNLVMGTYFMRLGSGGRVNGALVFTPPVPARNIASNMRYIGGGSGWDYSSSTRWSVTCELHPGFNNRLLFNFAGGGTSNWNRTTPFTWTMNDELTIFFLYERAL